MAGTQMQLEDWLDDLCVRFIINLPQEDLSSVSRICFQVEEAQWYYEDFIRPLDPTLPSMSLRIFSLRIFQHCPLLASFSAEHHTKAFEEFLQYKTRVPVRGAIMLNHAMDSVVLVKGWKKGASWSFPRGKINKDEDDLDCAIREVYEETGLDLRAAGLAPTEKKPKYIEISMREQQLRLYVFRDIPMDTDFQPRTRKEISKIQWYRLSDLPTFRKKGDKSAQNRIDAGVGGGGSKFYMVAPFLVPLKKWIASQKKVEEKRAISSETPANNAAQVSSPGDVAWAPESAPHDHLAGRNLGGGAGRSTAAQNHVQGPQADNQQDKGSALLSILQAGGQQRGTHMPQTPLDLTISSPPQPRNPHHHSNQQHAGSDKHAHEPPAPGFQIAPHSTTHPSTLPLRHTTSPWSASQIAGAIPPQRFRTTAEENGPAHGQSLPIHVQSAELSEGTFPEIPSAHQSGRGLSQRRSETPAAQGPGPTHPLAMQPPGPVRLNGHSMALLNVLKRDATPATPPAQDGDCGQNRWPCPSHGTASNFPFHAGHAVPQELPRLLDNSVRHASLPRSSWELAGSGGHVSSDNHRSALLGMFRKAEPKAARLEARGGNQGDSARFAQVGEDGKTKAMQSQKLQQRLPETRTFSLDQASTRTRLAHHNAPDGQGWENMAPRQRCSNQAPLQPTRILQRGQTPDEGGPMPSSRSSSHGSQALAGPGPLESSQTSTRAWPDEPRARPGGSDEQKRRLLSLFGQQQPPSMGSAQHGGENAKPRVASVASSIIEGPFDVTSSTSSRKGTETPMSPAEQSFFLEYLQTVTNNASR